MGPKWSRLKRRMGMSDQPRRLYRSRADRTFLGVCGGLGEVLQADATILRVLLGEGSRERARIERRSNEPLPRPLVSRPGAFSVTWQARGKPAVRRSRPKPALCLRLWGRPRDESDHRR